MLPASAPTRSGMHRELQDIQTGVFSGFVLLRTVAALLDHPVVKAEGLIAVSTTLLLSQLPFYVPKLGFIDRDVVHPVSIHVASPCPAKLPRRILFNKEQSCCHLIK